MMTGYVQAASLQDSLSSAIGQLGQNNSSSGSLSGLTGLLNGGNETLSAGNMNNAAGILQYCVQQKLVSTTSTENVKNQLLDKLGLTSQQEQQQQTDYTQGLAGLLNTSDGKQLNLNSIGNTPLAEKVKTKACDLVLKQGVNFIS
ncbi:Putative glycoprotein/receptor [Brenneria goodwinii]|nr:Putative glycoprotein/receptor [Brenneria goodwinii]